MIRSVWKTSVLVRCTALLNGRIVPSRVRPPLLVLISNLHTPLKTTAPSLKLLRTELLSLSKAGQLKEALEVVHNVQQLNYPMHSNVICQLLNFAIHWRNEDVFTTALGLITDSNITCDEQVYTTIIKGLLTFNGFNEAMKVYGEMTDKGLVPRQDLLYNLLEDCLKRKDTVNSCLFFDILLTRSLLPPTPLINEFIALCLEEGLHEYVMKLLEFFSVLTLPLDEELVHQLKWYFDKCTSRAPASDKHWNTALTTVSDKGVCLNCDAQLPPIILSKKQIDMLCAFIMKEIKQASVSSRTAAWGRQVATSQIHTLSKLIASKGPFHYIIDGLNVAYGGDNRFRFNKILKLCEKLNKNKDARILVIGGYQLIRHLIVGTVNGGRKMTKQEATQHYASLGIHLFIKHNRALDDLYLINATLMSGGSTLLVSNDQFRDHLHHIASCDPAMIRILKQWLLSSQVKMLSDKKSPFTLLYPPSYATTVHLDSSEDCYHIPTTNHHWLCVKRVIHYD